MPTEYAPDDKLQAAIEAVIRNPADPYVSGLRDNEVSIIGVFVQKTNSNGEEVKAKGAPVVLKKVSEVYYNWVFEKEPGNPARFLLLVDYPTWNEASPKRRVTMLHEVLTLLKVNKVATGLKFIVHSIPFMNPMTVAIHGQYCETVTDMNEVLAKAGAGNAVQRVINSLMGIAPKDARPKDDEADGEGQAEEAGEEAGELHGHGRQ